MPCGKLFNFLIIQRMVNKIMAQMKLVYTTSKKIDSLAIADGQIIYCPDDNIIALDKNAIKYIQSLLIKHRFHIHFQRIQFCICHVSLVEEDRIALGGGKEIRGCLGGYLLFGL